MNFIKGGVGMAVISPQFCKIDLPVSIKSTNEATGIFEGYAATYDLDLVSDRIKPGAFARTIAEAKASQKEHDFTFSHILLRQHQTDLPIGGVIEISEDRKGLHIVGQLDLDTELGRRAFSGMSKGYLKSLSIGYKSRKDHVERGVRVLEDISLIEISLVTFPANPEARIGAVKSDETAWALSLIHDMRRLVSDFEERRKASKMRDEYERPLMGTPGSNPLVSEPEPLHIEYGRPEESRVNFERELRAQMRAEDSLFEMTPGSKAFNRELEARRKAREKKQAEQKAALEAERKAQAEKHAAMSKDAYTPEQWAAATGYDLAWVRNWFAHAVNSGRVVPVDAGKLLLRAQDVRDIAKCDAEQLEYQAIKAAHKRAEKAA